jgi:large subunit ribosomal protein L22
MSSSLSFITSNCIKRRLLVSQGGNASAASAAYLFPIKRFSSPSGNFKQQDRSLKTSLAANLNIFSSRHFLTNRNHSIVSPWKKHSVHQNTTTVKCARSLSTQAAASSSTSVLPDGLQIHAEPTIIQPSIVQAPDGRQFAAFELPTFQRKLKPYIVKRRLARMKTFVGKQKNIRHSPWRMNLVCQFAAGQTLTDAIQQLEFCRKSMAPLVKKVLIRTANVADMKYGLQQSQLEVAECFATKGTPMKRIRVMGRGRAGRMEHKHSHFRVVLREIDYKLRIYQAPTLGQKKRWFLRQQQAEADFDRAKAERDEISRLEKETEAYRNKETKK